ncbi:MAG: hypothetical protein LUC94_05710 [Clostridiales bacterium]|nr:hypothetical protein [Clostridiales bacterium]
MKKWSIGAVAVVMTLAAAFPVHAGWEQDEVGYYYQNDSGSGACDQFMQIDGAWYFFDGTGHMAASSWYQKDGAWYYSDASGVMQTGWVLVNDEYYYLDASGAMKTGFLDLDGKRYYLDEGTGAMKYSANFVVDGRMYQAQADGSLRTNEIVESDGNMLRFNSDGTIDFKTATTSATDDSWHPYNIDYIDYIGCIGCEGLGYGPEVLLEEKMNDLYEEYKENVLTATSSSRRAIRQTIWEDKVTRRLSALNATEEQIKEYIYDVERGYYSSDDYDDDDYYYYD